MKILLIAQLLFSSLVIAHNSLRKLSAGNIVEVAKSDDDFSILVKALTRVNLADTLSVGGPYTVFAPTDDAFEEYLDGVSIDIVDEGKLKDILLYHVLSGEVKKSDLLDTDTVTALNENDISISTSLVIVKWWKWVYQVFLNDDTEVTAYDIMASNGVIHAIDTVLEPANSIYDVAKSNDDFSILVEALTRANLTDTLSGDGDFTVFAPTNDAFEEYLDGVSIDKVDVESLTQILLYHVLPVKVKKSDLLDTDTVTALNENDISVSAWFKWWKWVYQVFLNDDTEVTAFDIMASNGVIHVIDRVLKPAGNIVEVAKSDDDFSILVKALTRANLADTLSGDGDFTVFAPTNAAFEEYLDGDSIDTVDEGKLKDILLYHVLSGKVEKSDLLDTDTVTALDNNDIYISIYSSFWKYKKRKTNDLFEWLYEVIINDNTKVTKFDIIASNGVIHAIDTVLEPVGNIVEVAKSDDNFSILVEALTRANLADVLSGEGPYTVFAPTNAAFEEYLDGVSIDNVDLDSLTNILLNHVLSGKSKKLDLLDTDTVTALNENDISISAFFKWLKISSKKKTKQFEQHIDVFLNDDTEVTAFDIMASNGVIHVIDSVLD